MAQLLLNSLLAVLLFGALFFSRLSAFGQFAPSDFGPAEMMSVDGGDEFYGNGGADLLESMPKRAPLDRAAMVRFGKRAPLDRAAMVRFGKRAPLDRAAMVRFGKRAPLDRAAMVRFGRK